MSGTESPSPSSAPSMPEDEVSTPSGRPEIMDEKPTTQTSRLMISKIVCENFKSYAGVKELGPFHKVS